MRPPSFDHQRLIAVFILGAVLFNYPILSLFNQAGSLFGIPLLYVYIFAAWAGVIGLVAWIVERRG
jgi:hypothetical protein